MKHRIKQRDLEQLAAYWDDLCVNPKLTYLFLELTDACNLTCLHCGSCASPQNRTYLPFDIIKKVLQSVAKKYTPGQIMVCLTGGEPLMHPDFYKIARYAVDLGFSCGITTNGTLIDERAAGEIVASGIGSVSFSLDGLEDSHDWFRSGKGSYARTIHGIKALVEASRGRMVTQVTTVVHRGNLGQLDELYRQVLQLGVHSWRVINLEPIGRALQYPHLLLSAEEMKDLLTYIRNLRYSIHTPIDITYGCSHYLTTEFEREVRDNYFLCGSGIYVGSVLCNGDIFSCLDIPRRPELVQGNVFRDDFVDVWENRFREFRTDRCETSQICRDCPERRFCRGDATHTWDFDKQEPLLCVRKLCFLKGEAL
ncbi:MAG: radical SAM protein [Oscillospiraceae bacterium]|nr:radical SAM protein [Oscillospiraceae bacterium]